MEVLQKRSFCIPQKFARVISKDTETKDDSAADFNFSKHRGCSSAAQSQPSFKQPLECKAR